MPILQQVKVTCTVCQKQFKQWQGDVIVVPIPPVVCGWCSTKQGLKKILGLFGVKGD